MFMFRVNVAFHFPPIHFSAQHTFPSGFSHQLRSAVQWLVCVSWLSTGAASPVSPTTPFAEQMFGMSFRPKLIVLTEEPVVWFWSDAAAFFLVLVFGSDSLLPLLLSV